MYTDNTRTTIRRGNGPQRYDNAAGARARRLPTSLCRGAPCHGLGTPERVQSAWRLRKQSRPQLLHLRDRDVGAGAALRSGAQSVPPSSVSGAAPWQWLLQWDGASKWPSASRRQFTKHVDLRAANFGCGSSFLAVLDPSAAFLAVLRARSAVVFAGLRLVVGVWAETRQILWV